MREIKFRAWDTEEKMMTEPNIQCNFNSGCYGINSLFADHSKQFVWMQSTNLKDKNGKEIYEGDILEWSVYEDAQFSASGEEEESRWRDSVYFSNGCFAFEKRKELLFNFMAPHKKIEVIGNIYENPELLV